MGVIDWDVVSGEFPVGCFRLPQSFLHVEITNVRWGKSSVVCEVTVLVVHIICKWLKLAWCCGSYFQVSNNNSGVCSVFDYKININFKHLIIYI